MMHELLSNKLTSGAGEQVLDARYGCHVTVHCLQDAASPLNVNFHWEDSVQIVELAPKTYCNQNIAQPISCFGGKGDNSEGKPDPASCRFNRQEAGHRGLLTCR